MPTVPPPPPGRRFDSRLRCGCGEIATVRIEFLPTATRPAEVRWYCWPCS